MEFRNVGFKMYLKAGVVEEYQLRHAQIWPRLVALLKAAGLSDYSIFLDEDQRTLFACQKQQLSFDDERLRMDPIMQEWWDYMKDLMEVNADNSPKTSTLKAMFYLP